MKENKNILLNFFFGKALFFISEFKIKVLEDFINSKQKNKLLS